MTDRLPISVLLLARDELRDLEALIPALGFAREVVVVWDPRGDRAARDAAERLGARVFERAFDGFGPQRQFALGQCREEWVLWLDPDERLRSSGDAAAVIANHLSLAKSPAFRIPRASFFLGRRIRFCGWNGERVLRLFRRAESHFDDALVHEGVKTGAVEEGPSDLWIEHHSYATWEECTTKLVHYAHAGAESAWRAGRHASALEVLARPLLRFVRMYVLQLGVLDGAHGLVLCTLASLQVALKYGELWSRSRASRRS